MSEVLRLVRSSEFNVVKDWKMLLSIKQWAEAARRPEPGRSSGA